MLPSKTTSTPTQQLPAPSGLTRINRVVRTMQAAARPRALHCKAQAVLQLQLRTWGSLSRNAISVLNLQVDTSRDRLDFKWQLQPGGKDGAHYGLLLAQAVGFPEQVQHSCKEVQRASLI